MRASSITVGQNRKNDFEERRSFLRCVGKDVLDTEGKEGGLREKRVCGWISLDVIFSAWQKEREKGELRCSRVCGVHACILCNSFFESVSRAMNACVVSYSFQKM